MRIPSPAEQSIDPHAIALFYQLFVEVFADLI
jgi:hypothetical protein